jgi:serine protease Do
VPIFRDLVARTAPGTAVPVVVIRNDAERTLNVTVGQQKDQQVAQAEQAPASDRTRGKLGIVIGDINNPDIRQNLNLKDNIKSGVVITEIVPGSPASQADLQAGDMIVRLNGKTITSPDQVSDITNGLKPGSTVSIVVRRFDSTGGSETVLGTLNLD